MILCILLLGLILFFLFCILWKSELTKSIFFTLFFLFSLWLNSPCFVNVSNLENGNSLLAFPFKAYSQLSIIYIIIVNVLLVAVLHWQSKFINKTEYTYKEIKRMYDEFGEDAVELYAMWKDLDFLDKEKFQRQTNRIFHLKNNCKLLCNPTKDIKLLNMYKRACGKEVEVRFYSKSDQITNLKGQIKTNQKGIKKAMFTSKTKKKYNLTKINNQFLISAILEKYVDA